MRLYSVLAHFRTNLKAYRIPTCNQNSDKLFDSFESYVQTNCY